MSQIELHKHLHAIYFKHARISPKEVISSVFQTGGTSGDVYF